VKQGRLISNCCGALPWRGEEEHGICALCKEHCEFVVEGEEEETSAPPRLCVEKKEGECL
jgi:hypothetical protein